MSELPSVKDAAWLSQDDVKAIFAVLNQGGDSGRAVGGAVRNTLLGRTVTEIDFATKALPKTVMERASAAGIKVVPTGIGHGTVTLITGGRGHEVTTLREDIETDGRHAVVRFGDDWLADARRRDFTINAMSVEADGTLHDPIGGYPDIIARRVRFIGDADQRIAEDYLRILRFFRFYAECCFGPLDSAGLSAAVRGIEGLRGLAAERITHELRRLLVADRAADAVEEMQRAGIMHALIGSEGDIDRFRRMISFERIAGLEPSFARRIGALAVSSDAEETGLAELLRLSNSDRDTIKRALIDNQITDLPSVRQAKEWLYRSGREAFADRLTLAAAGSSAAVKDWVKLLELQSEWDPPTFPIGGADAIGAGIPRGPAIGTALTALEQWWIGEDFRPDRKALLRRLQQIHAAQQ